MWYIRTPNRWLQQWRDTTGVMHVNKDEIVVRESMQPGECLSEWSYLASRMSWLLAANILFILLQKVCFVCLLILPQFSCMRVQWTVNVGFWNMHWKSGHHIFIRKLNTAQLSQQMTLFTKTKLASFIDCPPPPPPPPKKLGRQRHIGIILSIHFTSQFSGEHSKKWLKATL